MTERQRKFDESVWEVVSRIKNGRVMSYGEVARAAGYPRHARLVSKAMARSDEVLPWYRVVRSDRTLAFEYDSKSYCKQRDLLAKEGVVIIDGKVTECSIADVATLDELIWGEPDIGDRS